MAPVAVLAHHSVAVRCATVMCSYWPWKLKVVSHVFGSRRLPSCAKCESETPVTDGDAVLPVAWPALGDAATLPLCTVAASSAMPGRTFFFVDGDTLRPLSRSTAGDLAGEAPRESDVREGEMDAPALGRLGRRDGVTDAELRIPPACTRVGL